ncbi:hypothetical protein D3C77_186370 [compost metagenome]
MRMSVNDAHQLQAMGLQAGKDLFMVATRVHDDGLFADRVADDCAVALQRADGEGFADELWLCNVHGKSSEVRVMPETITLHNRNWPR